MSRPSLARVSDIQRPRLVLYAVLGLIVCLLGARYLHAQAGSAGGTPAPGRTATTPQEPPGDGASGGVSLGRVDGGRVTVHVAGAVRRPDVYRMPAGARVDDAVHRAGGATRAADLDSINLAAKLEDGRQVLVPRAAAPGSTAAGSTAAGSTAGGAPSAAQAPATGPVNLNTATLEQLQTLDGVGPGIAQRILDYREQNGGFRRVEDLGAVSGIGVKRMATLTPLVSAG